MTTDNKTLAVDVLAVLDYEIQMIPLSTEDFGPQREQDVRDMRDARAAVAELIKTVDRLGRKAVEQARLTSSVFNSDLESVRAALARVKGESA